MATIRIGFLSLVWLVPVGCIMAPQDLSVPSGAAAVENAPERFAQQPDDSLFDEPAGRVIDDLSRLQGCWGAIEEGEQAAPLASNAVFYQFDLDAGIMIFQGVQRSGIVPGVLDFSFDVAWDLRYALAISGDDRITIDLSSSEFVSNFGPSVVLPLEDVPTQDIQLTLDGDKFRFGPGIDVPRDSDSAHDPNLIFSRFDCPQ